MFHNTDIDARLPNPELELAANKCLKIMAMVEIGGSNNCGLSISAVRFGDMIYAVLEVCV